MSLLGVITKLRYLNISSYVSGRSVQLLSTKVSNFAEISSEQKRQKKPHIPRITLIETDNISVTTFEDAQKLSKRRDLKLVKILDLDAKTQRPVYKLMTGAEYHAEDLKQRQEKKNEKQNASRGEKVLIFGTNIAEHDLNTHINKILKWINKRYEVRVVVNGDSASADKAERLFSCLESSVKDVGRILQKRQKGNDLKFQITPTKNDKKPNDS